MTLALTWLRSARSETFLMRSWGKTRFRCRVQRRSRTIPTSAIEQMMIGHMNGPPARTISHMAPDHTGARPKASVDTPPGERITRRCGGGKRGDTLRPEADLDGAIALRIENLRARAAPAFQRIGPRVAARDPAGSNHQSRSALFYPLGAGALGARLPTQDDHVAGERTGGQSCEQFALGCLVEIAAQQSATRPFAVTRSTQ